MSRKLTIEIKDNKCEFTVDEGTEFSYAEVLDIITDAYLAIEDEYDNGILCDKCPRTDCDACEEILYVSEKETN